MLPDDNKMTHESAAWHCSAVGKAGDSYTSRAVSTGTLDGTLDDVRIYNTALSADDIAALYAAELTARSERSTQHRSTCKPMLPK